MRKKWHYLNIWEFFAIYYILEEIMRKKWHCLEFSEFFGIYYRAEEIMRKKWHFLNFPAYSTYRRSEARSPAFGPLSNFWGWTHLLRSSCVRLRLAKDVFFEYLLRLTDRLSKFDVIVWSLDFDKRTWLPTYSFKMYLYLLFPTNIQYKKK